MTAFPLGHLKLEFPEILSKNIICYHLLSVSGNSEIMHCGMILINMPYQVPNSTVLNSKHSNPVELPSPPLPFDGGYRLLHLTCSLSTSTSTSSTVLCSNPVLFLYLAATLAEFSLWLSVIIPRKNLILSQIFSLFFWFQKNKAQHDQSSSILLNELIIYWMRFCERMLTMVICCIFQGSLRLSQFEASCDGKNTTMLIQHVLVSTITGIQNQLTVQAKQRNKVSIHSSRHSNTILCHTHIHSNILSEVSKSACNRKNTTNESNKIIGDSSSLQSQIKR